MSPLKLTISYYTTNTQPATNSTSDSSSTSDEQLLKQAKELCTKAQKLENTWQLGSFHTQQYVVSDKKRKPDTQLSTLKEITSKIKNGDNLIKLISEIQNTISKDAMEYFTSIILELDKLEIYQLKKLATTIKNKVPLQISRWRPYQKIEEKIEEKKENHFKRLLEESNIPRKDWELYYECFNNLLGNRTDQEIKNEIEYLKKAKETVLLKNQKQEYCKQIINLYQSSHKIK